MSWRLGDRVTQPNYGTGTIVELTDQHVVVHFDAHGRRRFAAHLAALTVVDQAASRADAARRSLIPGPRPRTERKTTDPGYENANRQTVVRATTTPGTVAGENLYVLKCGRCGAHYGTNASEIEQRKCPQCMDGPRGLTF